MLNLSPFEVITADGTRFRCEKPNHFWQYGLVSGTIDVEDKTVVEVLKIDEDEESELINTFSQVIMVGKVSDETFLQMPRERPQTQCPKCGFAEIKND